MKKIMENFEKFMAEQQPGTTTASAYRADVIDDRGQAGSATGVDDKERNLLLRISKKLAAAASVGNINSGTILMQAKKLEAQLNALLAKSAKSQNKE